MTQQYRIVLNIDEVELVQNSLQEWMEKQSEFAKMDNSTMAITADGDAVAIDISDLFVSQYVDAKNLRKRFVDLVGRDLTEEGV